MQISTKPNEGRRHETEPENLAAALRRLVVGQDEATEAILPYVDIYRAGLSPDGRPAGVFLLLGPTGTGKTRTVEALAEVLHGSDRKLLRIDCGEFQLEHEVAKLIGAPPGYLGHRETQPMINQHKLNATASDRCGLSLVLFDEIEKAAPSLGRLLLGVLDKASLKLGDNTSVNFERSLIFMTSNLGAREMAAALSARFGFDAREPESGRASRLHRLGVGAVRKRFSPEFVNRIDRILTYHPLSGKTLEAILDLQFEALDRQIRTRMGTAAFQLEFSAAARAFLLREGVSDQYGARELKRAIHRHLLQPLASLVLADQRILGGALWVDCDPGGDRLSFSAADSIPLAA